MAPANLTQAEADSLVAMEKRRSATRHSLLCRRLHRLRPSGGSGVRRRRHGNLPRHGPREVCGMPTDATGRAQTVTVTAQDAAAAAGDRGRLTFQVTVLDNPTVAAGLTAANPAPFPAPSPVV